MLNIASQNILKKQDLINYFLNASKTEEKIGLEYEKIGVNKSDFSYVHFEKIEKLLEKLNEFGNYKRIFNDNGEKVIGLQSEMGNITLEPGSQFELSVTPKNTLQDLDKQLKSYNEITRKLADNFDIIWLGSGLQPVSVYENIKIIPKKRYEFMSEYLPQKADLPLVMMRETAGIQTAIDYKDEQDAIEKLRLALKLSPIVSAVFSNSPIRNSKLSGYKSFRAKSWTQTDNERCGLVSKKLFDKNTYFSLSDYVDILCNVQMIMLNYDNRVISVKDFTFKDFMEYGCFNNKPKIKDFEQHLSLFFTDVRLKKYIEIRNHDSQKENFVMCVPAFWKGIMYNQDAMDNVNSILKNFTYENYEQLRCDAPKNGIDCNIGDKNLKNIAKEIFKIAYFSLKKTNEEKYLEPILELVIDEITPADIIIKNFETLWKGDISKYINYCQI